MEKLNSKNKNISFSLLIPCFGDAIHIQEMIDSIIENNYPSIEIIVCLQGDTTATLNGEKYRDVKFIHKEKPSSYLSRIELYRKASGDYIWFLDDDDEIENNALHILNAQIIEHEEPDCIFIDNKTFLNEIEFYNYVRPEFSVHSKTISKDEALNHFITTNKINNVWGKVFRRTINPNWETNFDVFQSDDKILSFSILKASNSFLNIQFPLYKYFAYRSHSLKNKNIKKLEDSLKVKSFLVSCFNIEKSGFLLFDGYLNIKSFVLNNRHIKKIKTIFKNEVVQNFISLQAKQKDLVKKHCSFKDKLLFNLIIKKRVLFIFLTTLFLGKDKQKRLAKYHHISLGYNCSVAYNLKENMLRSSSSPFDWFVTFEIKNVIDCIDSHFSKLFNKKYIFQDDAINKWYLNTYYNILFGHDFTSYDKFPIKFIGFKQKYKRRIKRFYKEIKKPTIFYRYCYLEKDIEYIVNNSERIIDAFTKYNKNNKLILIIDESFLEKKSSYPTPFILCNNPSKDWNKLENCSEFKQFVSKFEKHDNKIKESSLKKITSKILNKITRQKAPYIYKKQYKHFDIY